MESRRANKLVIAGEKPLYNIAEAARFLGIPSSTVRTWVQGRKSPHSQSNKYAPVIKVAADEGPYRISFNNLIELYVLRTLRRKHDVKLPDIRRALDYAEQKLGIERLLIHPELKTDGGNLFIEHYGKLISLNRSGQIALKELLRNALMRVEWENDLPSNLYLPIPERAERKSVSVNPLISYGLPAVHGVETKIIAARVDAGEEAADLAEDYGIPLDDVIDAIVFEGTLARAA